MVAGVIEQGLIYGIMILGVYISYKILDFPDLTVDGSFTLGAAITTVLIIKGCNPYLCLPVSLVFGGIAGLCTGIIHVKFKIRDLLSGIIMMMVLYSINLRIVGRANVAFMNANTIFTNNFPSSFLGGYQKVIIILVIIVIIKILLDLYLKTKSGYLLLATGQNSNLVNSLSKNSGNMKIIGLVIENALVALSGSILCQDQRFFEITMGTGAVIIALASVIIGIQLLKNVKFFKSTTSVIIGSIVYKFGIAISLYIGFQATDMRLITAILFLAVLIIGQGESKKKIKST